MPQARWYGTVIADSDETVEVDGFTYFPPESVEQTFLRESDTVSHCPNKGQASYYHIVVEGEEHEDAAWTYRQPQEGYEHIAGWIAFWNGVEVA